VKEIQELKGKLSGKKVLLRVDYNVPIKDGVVGDIERIQTSLKTINFLVQEGASVVLCSHLGRPEGKKDLKFSLSQVLDTVKQQIGKGISFIEDCVGEKRDKIVAELKNSEIVLLENVRFYTEEEANDKEFAKKLAFGCDYYINDAFSASHRKHASIVGVTEYIEGYAGFALQKEVENLSNLLNDPQRPFVVISGGAKISDKIGILNNLLSKVDTILIGGGMANTFLAAEGLEIGKSLIEKDFIEEAGKILEEAKEKDVQIILPFDVIACKVIGKTDKGEIKNITEILLDDIIVDIGPKTMQLFEDEILKAKTVFWNGPLGITEYSQFAFGTIKVGESLVESRSFSVIGGGDTISALPKEIKDDFSFVSMAGGASLEFLEGKSLPGIEVL